MRREYARNILNFQTKRGNDPKKRTQNDWAARGGGGGCLFDDIEYDKLCNPELNICMAKSNFLTTFFKTLAHAWQFLKKLNVGFQMKHCGKATLSNFWHVSV